MIPWESLDRRLAIIGKDRAWLAEQAPYSPDSIQNAMAPNSKRRSEKMRIILSRVIMDEEKRQGFGVPSQPVREVRQGVYDVFSTDEERHRADLASRMVGAASLADYCREVVRRYTDEVLAGSAVKSHPDLPPSPGTSSPGDPEAESESEVT